MLSNGAVGAQRRWVTAYAARILRTQGKTSCRAEQRFRFGPWWPGASTIESSRGRNKMQEQGDRNRTLVHTRICATIAEDGQAPFSRYKGRLESPLVSRRSGMGSQRLQQARQSDLESQSLRADPMFADIDKGDLRLKPESPAFGLGFKPIDTSPIGLLPHHPYFRQLAEW